MSRTLRLYKFCGCRSRILLLAVIIALAPTSFGQYHQYFLTINNQNQRNFLSEESGLPDLSTPLESSPVSSALDNNSSEALVEENNTTIIVIKSVRNNSSELSQTAMDVITIVWYVATFLALAAFFMLMACSDRRCSDTQQSRRNARSNDTPIPPPTPSPSYSEFAPPSYDSVMRLQHGAKPSIFVIPFPVEDDRNKDNNTSANPTQTAAATTAPNVSFYTINELHKLGS